MNTIACTPVFSISISNLGKWSPWPKRLVWWLR